MARFYVFASQAEAQTAIDQIDTRARQIYAAQGYTVEADGSVVGKRASDGADMPTAARTETWDVPLQRLDGKWVVHHVETCPGHDFVIDQNGTTVAQFVGQDVASQLIEIYDLSWWPVAVAP